MAEEQPPPGMIVLTDDPRYQLAYHTQPDTASGHSGTIQMQITPAKDWHLAPEARATLQLEGDSAIAFDQKEVEGQIREDENLLLFGSKLKRTGSGKGTASGTVQFGMCEGDSKLCVIFRRDLSLSIRLAAKDSQGS